MNNVRNNIRKNFTIAPNELINDNNITDRARFLFIYMSSKPHDWVYYNRQLSNALNYSIDTLRKYLKELIVSGWIIKEKQKRTSGKFTSNTYILNSEPVMILPCRKNTDTVNFCDGKNKTLSNKEYTKKENIKRKNLII
ncbi:helix-turn-helix domain-containing protein [uncultured Polaribacter sp.]|uniref:helix-turn-helix domain-containing protein n=1 Tax=uncultured Polaribacter sp. TaxID=174711 RepID=UPI0026383FB7|nr:helix-turn-helix domain-containing protein [uncultured Polaribacter sp.]